MIRRKLLNIISYINSQNRLDRPLYSEISNYIYSLKSYEWGVFITNLENLFLYSSNNKNVANEDCKKK